jgi:hypothetical protein
MVEEATENKRQSRAEKRGDGAGDNTREDNTRAEETKTKSKDNLVSVTDQKRMTNK